MPRLATPLPNEHVLTRQELQSFWSSKYQETSDRIYRLTKQHILAPIRKGIFLNTRFGLMGEVGLVKIAIAQFAH